MTVDPYTDPATGCLHNLLGITDPALLLVVEAAFAAEAERSLRAHPSLISQTWDAAHWRAVHRHLFSDVYRWAGDFRTVDIQKGRSPVPSARPTRARRCLERRPAAGRRRGPGPSA